MLNLTDEVDPTLLGTLGGCVCVGLTSLGKYMIFSMGNKYKLILGDIRVFQHETHLIIS